MVDLAAMRLEFWICNVRRITQAWHETTPTFYSWDLAYSACAPALFQFETLGLAWTTAIRLKVVSGLKKAERGQSPLTNELNQFVLASSSVAGRAIMGAGSPIRRAARGFADIRTSSTGGGRAWSTLWRRITRSAI